MQLLKLKLLELCKTRTKKSSPDMSNFYVVWLVMTRSVTLAGLPRARANSKPHHYKQKLQKMKDLPITWVSTWKQFEDFRLKKRTETLFSTFQKKSVEHKDPKSINWTWRSWTVRVKLNKTLKKGNQIKTVGTLQNRNYEFNTWDAQILRSVGWSWQGHGHWQVYHMPEQIQSSTIT